MKKLVSLFLAALMLLCLAPVSLALPAKDVRPAAETMENNEPVRTVYSGTCGDNLNWTLDTETKVLHITGSGDMYDYETFSSGNRAPWLTYGQSSITTVVIANSVTSIGAYAFIGCTKLNSITIPDSVISIGEYAFSGCSKLTGTIIPDSVTNIARYAFNGCTGLTSVTIGGGIVSIGDRAFRGCSALPNILFLGAPPASIGNNVFEGCPSDLYFCYAPEFAAEWSPNGESVWNGYPILQVGTYYGTCGDNLYWTLYADTGLLNITGTGDMTNYSSSTSAPWKSYLSYIVSVNISDGVTSIGNYAFNNEYNSHWISSVTIGSSVTRIGARAFFNNCSQLTSLIIPDSVISIGDSAFYKCSNLTDISLGNSVESIGAYAFYECSMLASLDIPDSVKTIGSYAFYDCIRLTSLHFGSGVTTIGPYAFYYGMFSSITLPDSLIEIGSYAFKCCIQLNQLRIPCNVTSLGIRTFDSCTSLTKVIIPKSVISYGDSVGEVFYNCSNLSSAYFLGAKPSSSRVFVQCSPDLCIYYTIDYISNWAPNGETTYSGYPIMLEQHVWDDGVVTVPPTGTQPGIMTYTCLNCGETMTEEIPPLGQSTVTFVDWDGTIIDVQLVDNGSAAAAPADPVRPGYDFIGWDVDFSCVTCDITVTAQYEVSSHTVTFVDWDGAVLKVQTVPHGGSATAPAAPTREGWLFVGWDRAFNNVTEDITVTAQYVLDSDLPKIVVDSKTTTAGNNIVVSIKLQDNPGIVSMKLRLAYDPALTLVSVEDTGLLPGKMHSATLTNPYLLVWENDTAVTDYVVDGVLVKLTFSVPEGLEVGEYPVTVTYDPEDYDIFNCELEPVIFTVINGKITVIDVLIGDVNSDGRVNAMDRALLGRFLAGWASVPASMINMTAADVNLDGRVNTMDRAVLGRYLAGWAGYGELPHTTKGALEPAAAPNRTGGAPTVTVGSVYAQPGETVTVDVSLENNPGVISMMLKLAYDPALTLISVEDTGVMPGRVHDLENFINPYILYWANETAESNITANGVVARFTFRLADDAEAGFYPVTVSYDNDNADIFDYDFNPVAFEVVNGGVSVEASAGLPGDVNGDGMFNFNDISTLSMYLLGTGTLAEGAEANADYNGDGKVDFKDISDMYMAILG